MERQGKPSIPELADLFINEVLTGANHNFFNYGTAIVEPVKEADTGVGRLKTLGVPNLKWYLRRQLADQSESTINSVAEDLLHNPALPLLRIRGLVTTPTFRSDFSLITKPGFDDESGLYYSPDPSLETFEFRTDADREKSRDSLGMIFELLTDFPFRDANERYIYVATLLTLFLRSSIRSVIPCLAINGNGQSVGKGLLSSMLSMIAFGEDASTIGAPKGRDEWASKLDSILVSGAPFQIIDNIVGAFASDDFASILTSARRNVRIKGQTKVVTVPVNTVWVLNGNDLSVDSDLAQRIIMCNLQHEDAASRKQEQFYIQQKYGTSIDILIRRERAKYIQACLDLVCGWVNAGAARRKKLVLAKYGDWEAVVGGIIDWIAPEARFLADHHRQTAAIDGEKEETIIFLKRLMTTFPSCDQNEIGASDIAAQVFPTFGKSTLRDYVPDGLLGKGGSSFSKCLGRWLKKASTRRWGNIELIAVHDKHEGVWKYRIGEDIKHRCKHAGIFKVTEAATAA